MDKVTALFQAKLWQIFAWGGLTVFILGVAEITWVPVVDEYRPWAMGVGVIMMFAGAWFAWIRAKKLGEGK